LLQKLCSVRSSHHNITIIPREEKEARHVTHMGEKKIINIFVRDLSREKKNWRLKRGLKDDATKRGMGVYDTSGPG
jgi:hypothetical protein